jgi:hypothetical protein
MPDKRIEAGVERVWNVEHLCGDLQAGGPCNCTSHENFITKQDLEAILRDLLTEAERDYQCPACGGRWQNVLAIAETEAAERARRAILSTLVLKGHRGGSVFIVQNMTTEELLP